MGILKVGKPLEWKDTVNHSSYIREHGVRQFLHQWKNVRDLSHDRLYYGDELEYGLLKLDKINREVRISCRSGEVMAELRRREEGHQEHIVGCTWHQEYGAWMVEGTPSGPYGGYTSSLVLVEKNMRLRRARLLAALAQDEIAPTVVNFPLMGVGAFIHPPAEVGGPMSLSGFVPDACINPHPRFGTLTANIRSRRGSKVDIRVPLFKDTNTVPMQPYKRRRLSEGSISGTNSDEAMEDQEFAGTIEMDCMAFGMGCCCLQVTFQAADMLESRYLYDQLGTLAPIVMALTAAAPIFRGYLSGIDVRFDVIAMSVDDRTPAERGAEPTAGETKSDSRMAGGGVMRMSKSRYDSISCFLQEDIDQEYYNDVSCEVDKQTHDVLTSEGVDGPLARHIAHLFTRDPLVAFDGAIEEVNDAESTEHFDSINSTNWQTVRWKPPPHSVPCKPHIGWRTEFRPMEIQLTDFENAAFTAFIVLLTRVLLVFDLDVMVPLSKVDENMRRAHSIDAVNKEKFWFRSRVGEAGCPQTQEFPKGKNEEQMSMAEIINGKGCYFPGLVPLCYAYLEHINCDNSSLERLKKFLTFIQQRASGTLLTPATWIRRFVQSHPAYKQDSRVSQEIAYDLMVACDEIGRGVRACPELHGDVKIDEVMKEGVYPTLLTTDLTSGDALKALLQKVRARAADCDGPGSKPASACQRRFCFERRRSESRERR